MGKKKISNNRINFQDILLLIFFVSISAFRLNWYIALGSFILIFVYSILKDGKIYITSALKWGLLFWGYYLLSILWAHDISDTLRYISAIVYTIGIFCFMPKLIHNQEELVKTLKILFYSLVITAAIVFIRTPLSEFGTERVGSIIGLNENSFGMRMAIGAMLGVYLYKTANIKKSKILYIILIIALAALTLLSGSKKALLLLILGIAAVMFIYSKGIQKIQKTISLVAIAAIILFIIFNNPVLYSTIGNRIERTFLTVTGNNSNNTSLKVIGKTVGTTDKSLIERKYYINQGIELFKKYPLFGYGGNNFATKMREIGYSHVAYSHNNYVELLCTLGIVGFILYYSYWAITIVRLIKMHKRTNERQLKRMSLLLLSILCIYLILEYGNVSYIQEFNMLILSIADIFIYINAQDNKKCISGNSKLSINKKVKNETIES